MQFLLLGLPELVSNLNNEDFIITYEEFEENTEIMAEKGVYPYNYMNSWDKFNETKLPSIEDFYNALTDEECSIDDYKRAQNVWRKMRCRTMGDYHDIYVRSDVALLCDVFEKFRKSAISYYGIDPCHYYTNPGYSWDAMLKFTKVKLELITDIDMYIFIEKSIRGGISMIGKRHAKANNIHMKNYDKSKKGVSITYDYANNLYGLAMTQKLPHSKFKWLSQEEIDSFKVIEQNKIFKITMPKICIENDTVDYVEVDVEGDIGYFLEVDIHCPEKYFDYFDDFPLCPESKIITNDMLSPFITKVQEKMNLKEDKTAKLILDLLPKKNYICHIKYLKTCVERGYVITKIHNAISFYQSAWMKSYVDFNTKRRAESAIKSVQELCKNSVNSVFGKTMENLRNRTEFRFAADELMHEKISYKSNVKDTIHFNEILTGFMLSKKTLTLNKPIYAGASILDLSKITMIEYHYDYIKEKYGKDSKLLFTDTDSLSYELQTDDLYRDRIGSNLFDTSNYPEDHMLFSNKNNKVLGKFKDEAKGIPIIEFTGLRAKMYSLKYEESEEKKAKGISKSESSNTLFFSVCTTVTHSP